MSATEPEPAPSEDLLPGVRELDHTADVGIEIHAAEASELFRRAALGMARLLRGKGRFDAAVEERTLRLEAGSMDRLLVRWLSELLYLDEVDGFVFEGVAFDELGPRRLEATVSGRIEPDLPERQLKGVTYHDLRLESAPDDWNARVIFDI